MAFYNKIIPLYQQDGRNAPAIGNAVVRQFAPDSQVTGLLSALSVLRGLVPVLGWLAYVDQVSGMITLTVPRDTAAGDYTLKIPSALLTHYVLTVRVERERRR